MSTALEGILATFHGLRFAVREESELQEGVRRELARSGIEHEEQVKLGPGERIDFMCGSVGVELKTRGTLSSLIRQLDRYAQSERVGALVVLSTRRALICLPPEIRQKPVHGLAVGAL